MRTIKFRGWLLEKKRISRSFTIFDYCQECSAVILHNPDEYFDIDEEYLMQFTGLVDKNGKEIYEGDIVAYSITAPWDENQSVNVKSQVVWTNSAWWLSNEEGSDADGYLEDFGGLEVIGNIWENKELLK